MPPCIRSALEVIRQNGNSFHHISNSSFHSEWILPSEATIVVSHKCPIIGKQVAVIFFNITDYHSNDMTC